MGAELILLRLFYRQLQNRTTIKLLSLSSCGMLIAALGVPKIGYKTRENGKMQKSHQQQGIKKRKTGKSKKKQSPQGIKQRKNGKMQKKPPTIDRVQNYENGKMQKRHPQQLFLAFFSEITENFDILLNLKLERKKQANLNGKSSDLKAFYPKCFFQHSHKQNLMRWIMEIHSFTKM